MLGAVLKSKAHLVGIHERVRSDVEGNLPPKSSVQSQKGPSSTTQGDAKPVKTAANPNAEDAAELLRYILIPFFGNEQKSFSQPHPYSYLSIYSSEFWFWL